MNIKLDVLDQVYIIIAFVTSKKFDYYGVVMEYITVAKVAKVKGVSRATVHRWIHMGKIDSKNFKGRVKIACNHKLESINTNNLQHTLRAYEQRLLCLEELVQERLRYLKHMIEKQGREIMESENDTLTQNTRKTTTQRKTTKKYKRRRISDGKRNEIVNLVKQALNKGIMKKDLDPKNRGRAIVRMLDNPKRTTDKKLYELEKNARNLLRKI